MDKYSASKLNLATKTHATEKESPLRGALGMQESSIAVLHKAVEELHNQLEGLCTPHETATTKAAERPEIPPILHSDILAKVLVNTHDIEEAISKLTSLSLRLEV